MTKLNLFETKQGEIIKRLRQEIEVLKRETIEWISVEDRLPELRDDSVIVNFPDGSAAMVHIEDYFHEVTAGLDKDGNQLYTKIYITEGITHWHDMLEPPNE